MLKALSKLTLKPNEPNFLIGIAGNGLSTKLQTEIYGSKPADVIYLNYINFPEPSESKILVEFINQLLIYTTGKTLSKEIQFDEQNLFNTFTHAIDFLKDAKIIRNELTIIFDEFQRLKNFSNAFFFALDKIVSVSRIIPEIKLTTIFIADEYLNPRENTTAEGIGKFFLHYLNFEVIPSQDPEDITDERIVSLFEKKDKDTKSNIRKLSGDIPSLFIALLEIDPDDMTVMKLLENYEIEWKINEVWDSVGKTNQELLKAMLLKKDVIVNNALQDRFLRKTNIVDLEKKHIVSKLLEHYVSRQINLESIGKSDYLVINDNQIFLPDLPLQQEKVLLQLFHNRGNVVTRDEIAQTLWGEKYLERYSDYAIDKLMSKTRKIIDSNSTTKGKLKTKKGRGYLLEK